MLCVDNFTLRLVSSLYKVSQLAEENFYLVENITMKSERGEYLDRQPMPSLPVLYFITPTVESVNRMLHDYRDKKSQSTARRTSASPRTSRTRCSSRSRRRR